MRRAGNENPAASVLGEVVPSHDFYSYDAKYLDGNRAALEIPARLDCQSHSGTFDKGVSDAWMQGADQRNQHHTRIHQDMHVPKLWEASGIGYAELIGWLIDLAIERHERKRGLKTSR